MRNWLLALLVVFLLVGPAAALTLPNPQAGVAFSLIDNKVNHFESMEIVTWKGLALSGGYMGEADATDHKIIATLNYDILSLIGVEWPITKYLTCKPGIYSGVGSINTHRLLESEFDWGLSLSVLQIKW